MNWCFRGCSRSCHSAYARCSGGRLMKVTLEVS